MSRQKSLRPQWVRLVKEPDPTQPDPVRICGPKDVFALLHPRASAELVECFYTILLNSQSRVLAMSEVTRGILNSSLVHPREVFRLALVYPCAGIILAHNHPSGDPTPSAEDRLVTRQMMDAGKLLDVPVLDHIIIGADRYVSFAEAGLL